MDSGRQERNFGLRHPVTIIPAVTIPNPNPKDKSCRSIGMKIIRNPSNQEFLEIGTGRPITRQDGTKDFYINRPCWLPILKPEDFDYYMQMLLAMKQDWLRKVYKQRASASRAQDML